MKIICIARNYKEHVEELHNELKGEPIFFLKPDSSLLVNNKPFFLPDFSNEIHYEVEIVLKIKNAGKNINRKYAYKYFDEITVGIDFTARDLQRKAAKEGNPWEIAKAFDRSAPIGKFVRKDLFQDINNLNFRLEKNGVVVQQGNTSQMIYSFYEIIEYVSKFLTLKTGDLIFTGTPKGVGPVNINDHLVAYIEDIPLLDFYVK